MRRGRARRRRASRSLARSAVEAVVRVHHTQNPARGATVACRHGTPCAPRRARAACDNPRHGPRRPLRRPDRQPRRLPSLVAGVPRAGARPVQRVRAAGAPGSRPPSWPARPGRTRRGRRLGRGRRMRTTSPPRGRPARHRRGRGGHAARRRRADFLGGQFIHAVVASMDWGGMADFFRTGIAARSTGRTAIGPPSNASPARTSRSSSRRCSRRCPQLAADLTRGGRVVDVHCGGGRWLVAMARRFPQLELVGVEFEADSVARARATVEPMGLARPDRHPPGQGHRAGLGRRVRPRLLPVRPPPAATTPRRCCVRRGRALRPGGRLLVLDWPLPSSPRSSGPATARSSPGSSSTSCSRARPSRRASSSSPGSTEAGLPAPMAIDLPSGAALFVAERVAD